MNQCAWSASARDDSPKAPMAYTSSARAYAPAVTDDHMLPGERVRARVNLVRWAQVIPANAWPSGLPRTGVLCCRDVFATAGHWSAGHITVRALLAASCMWGNGSAGYGPSRTLTALRADPKGDKLEHNLEPLRGQHPSEADLRSAYQSSTARRRRTCAALGAAFFTKVLYFAGYRRGVGGVQPLILDRRVARHLPPAAGSAHARRWGWPSEHWIAYLRWAADQATRTVFGGEPDAVEMALFSGEWEPDDQ